MFLGSAYDPYIGDVPIGEVQSQGVLKDRLEERAEQAKLVSLSGGFVRRTNLFLKRTFDIVCSAMALLVLAPFFVMVVIAIRLETPGKAIFVQERWGKDKKRIRVYKFRSMFFGDCDKTGVTQTKQNDTRITKIGAFLRKSNIDELPQLLNVLKGDMSLVGPRCHPIGMSANGERYEDFVPYYHTRHVMKPGITGLAQVKGYRGPTITFEQSFGRIDHDIEYIRNFNVWMDIKLIFQTVVVEVRGGTGF